MADRRRPRPRVRVRGRGRPAPSPSPPALRPSLLLAASAVLRSPAASLSPPASAGLPRPIALAVGARPCVGHATSTVPVPVPVPAYEAEAEAASGGRPVRVHYVVIGTSHLRCNSAREVRELIGQVRPDGVVVELDPERAVRLTKAGAGSGDAESGDGGPGVLFGEDFLSAIDAAKELDVPLFLGDEYPKETRERLVRTALVPGSYGAGRLLAALSPRRSAGGNGPGSSSSSSSRIDLAGSLVQDPRKLLPLATVVSPPLLLLLGTLPAYQYGDWATNASTLLSLAISFLLSTKVFNTLIADRDEILAARMRNAASVVASLQRGGSVRKRWTFAVNEDRPATLIGGPVGGGTGDEPAAYSIPLFTLKSPLRSEMTRNLNLFEPRWLKMIDDVTSRRSVGSQSFGCVTCTNKFYSAIDLDGAEGRYADVIFRREGTMARITALTEGTRPVSGDRRLSVEIEGGDSFLVDDEDGISLSQEGYLVARHPPHCERSCGNDRGRNGAEEEGAVDRDVTILAVVGLGHANGVIDLLSGRS